MCSLGYPFHFSEAHIHVNPRAIFEEKDVLVRDAQVFEGLSNSFCISNDIFEVGI
jgi:hypothetical protein